MNGVVALERRERPKHQQRTGREDAISSNTVNRWLALIRREDTDFEDRPRSGRPHAVEDSLLSKRIPRLAPGHEARLGCTHSTVLSRFQASATEKCSFNGKMYTRVNRMP